MNKLLCFLCVLLLSANLHASSISSSSSSGYVGPFLNFIDAGADNDQWNLSALVVAPTSTPNSDLSLNIRGRENPVSPQLIDTINGQKFWRYLLSFPRGNISMRVTYQIGSGTDFTIDIPARKTDPHVFFGTCNEYGNPTTIWRKINKNHAEKPFHLAILDGNQIYLDMGWGDHGAGVFSVDSVKQIMMAADPQIRMSTLPDDKAQHIEGDVVAALLKYYGEHYSKPGFKEFLATIPSNPSYGLNFS